jgi:simple sugar transport system permease protein
MISSVEGYKFTAGAKFFRAELPFADSLGWFGDLFLSYGVMVYLSIAIAIGTAFVLNKTKTGLHLRAVGENPATADAAGINVKRYRYVSTCTGCAISGLGGLMFVMDYLNGNWEYVIDAIGWLCVALVIFTTWKPVPGIFCSIVFGAFYVAAEYIPGISLAAKEIFKMLPYIVTIVVLVVTSIANKKENQPPASLGLSYFREER